MKKPEPLYTVVEVAEILNCSVKTVRRRIRSKHLRAIQDDGLLRVAPADLDFIRDHSSHFSQVPVRRCLAPQGMEPPTAQG